MVLKRVLQNSLLVLGSLIVIRELPLQELVIPSEPDFTNPAL